MKEEGKCLMLFPGRQTERRSPYTVRMMKSNRERLLDQKSNNGTMNGSIHCGQISLIVWRNRTTSFHYRVSAQSRRFNCGLKHTENPARYPAVEGSRTILHIARIETLRRKKIRIDTHEIKFHYITELSHCLNALLLFTEQNCSLIYIASSPFSVLPTHPASFFSESFLSFLLLSSVSYTL